MKQRTLLLALLLSLVASAQLAVAQSFPKPSPYPVTWEFEFSHGVARRIVVKGPGDAIPQAYWYLPYKVTNNTGEERMFLPLFELVTNSGHVIRSDENISPAVFDAIKTREGNKFLEHPLKVAGLLRLGEDQARHSVAIWREPAAEMGSFSIFVNGLSGEAVIMKDADGNVLKDPSDKPLILRKTLRLNYFVRGDEVYPGEDEVNENPEEWVMR